MLCRYNLTSQCGSYTLANRVRTMCPSTFSPLALLGVTFLEGL